MTVITVSPRPAARSRYVAAPGSLSALLGPVHRADNDAAPDASVCVVHDLPRDPAAVVLLDGNDACARCACEAIERGAARLGDVASDPASCRLAAPLIAAQDRADAHAADIVRRGLAILARRDPQALRSALAQVGLGAL